MSSFARTSVFINLGYGCNTVATGLQEFPTSGLHAGAAVVEDAMSTASGIHRILKIIPTVDVTRVANSAEKSLRAASLAQSTLPSSLPHLPPGNGRRFFVRLARG